MKSTTRRELVAAWSLKLGVPIPLHTFAFLGISSVCSIFACSALLAGPDECNSGEVGCDGNDVVICELPCAEIGCNHRWSHRPCSGTCVNPKGAPFCARSSTPDSKCADRSGYCDDNSAVQCRDGFAVSEQNCAGSDVCAASGSSSFCALSGQRDPRCAADDSEHKTCEGTSLITCRAGFVQAIDVCPIACVDSFCALSSQPDPMCAGNRAAARYCDGDVLVMCSEGFDFERTDCAAADFGSSGGTCWASMEGAICGPRGDGG
jgi:hypothetical protein